jgi:hypothetical protein
MIGEKEGREGAKWHEKINKISTNSWAKANGTEGD